MKVAANQWLFSEYNDPAFDLSLRTLDLQIRIADIYEDIEFSEA
ncbi:hypothetical protein [Thermoleptolyngbya sp.]